MTEEGGGFLIFGIPVLTMEDDSLQFFRQAPEAGFAFGCLDSFQAKVNRLF